MGIIFSTVLPPRQVVVDYGDPVVVVPPIDTDKNDKVLLLTSKRIGREVTLSINILSQRCRPSKVLDSTDCPRTLLNSI